MLAAEKNDHFFLSMEEFLPIRQRPQTPMAPEEEQGRRQMNPLAEIAGTRDNQWLVPGGGKLGQHQDTCRSVMRQAERSQSR